MHYAPLMLFKNHPYNTHLYGIQNTYLKLIHTKNEITYKTSKCAVFSFAPSSKPLFTSHTDNIDLDAVQSES